jgi:hypothetical protein
MKTPDLNPDWVVEDLSEQGQLDLGRLKHFGGGAYDVEAGLAAFEERIGDGQQPSPGSARRPRGFLIGALAVCGIASIVSFAVLRTGESAPPPAARAPVAIAAEAPPVPTTATAARATEITPSMTSVSVDALPTVATAHSRPMAPPAGTTAIAPSAAAAEASDLVEAEVRHASTLRIAARTDPERALALAAEGDRLYPKGLLHAEREAIAIEALARLDRWSEAQARGEAFANAYPLHPRTGRIRAIVNRERPWEL